MVQPWVADCSAAHPSVAQLRAAGAVGVMRYIAPGRNDGVPITAAEVADYHANNFPYGLVMEFDAAWILRGYQAGFDLARAALQIEASLGIPAGVTHAACDFDIQPSQYPQALDTLRGMADAYGSWDRVRPYGSKAFCEWVQANSPIRGSWSTFAWSWNQAANQFEHAADARLWQYNYWPAGTPVVDGCDYNQVLGDWAPRNTTSEDDMTPAQDQLQKTMAGAILQLSGKFDALAQSVIHGDATHYSLDHLAKDMGTLLAAVKAAPPGSPTDPALMQAVTDLGTKLDNLKLGVVA